METRILYAVFIFSIFVYWCFNEKAGLQLGLIVLFSNWIISIYRHLYEYLPLNINFSWIIFAVVFFGYFLLCNKIISLLSKGGFRAYMIAAAIVSFFMILYRPSLSFIINAGIFLGLCVGYCLNKRYVGFKSFDYLQRKSLVKFLTLSARFILGLAVFVFLLFGVGKIFEIFSESQNIELIIFICYVFISLWISAAAPWVFVKIRLAGTGEQKQ